MDEIGDLFEKLEEIEDIGEEILDPEDLVEDLIEDPVEVLLAVAAIVAGIVTIIVLIILALFLVLTTGPLAILAVFAGMTFFITILAVGLFLYFRTDIPRHMEKKIDRALEEADDNKRKDESMTEEEAINEIKQKYSAGELTENELEEALDEVVKHDQKPKQVTKEYQ